MFKKLRNRLILINLGITSIVIIASFTAIYLFSTHSASQRPPMINEKINSSSEFFSQSFSDDFERVITVTIKNEKEAAARDLLILLIVSGIGIELVVAFISYLLAEEAIKPVREAYETQKVFIANASHEIKTPLASISANLEAADIKKNHWIKNVEEETAKLTELNNQLLTLARADLVTNSTATEVCLGELVDKLVSSFEPRLTGIDFSKNDTTNGKVKLSVADFSQIFNILMDNAIKYSKKKIILELSNHKLSLSNDGAKIPKAKLAHVFERFYQVGKSADGVGLGLSIAKVTADNNGWVLKVESNQLTTFTLEF